MFKLNAENMYKSCLRKKRYSNEFKAVKIAKDMGKKFDCNFRVYHCALCNNFHLTKTKADER